MTAPRLAYYDWRGGREAMLRFGPDAGPIVIAALPLFEEANRTRAFVVQVLRDLAAHGVGSVLPDFPGQGESPLPTAETDIDTMRDAYDAVVEAVGRSSLPYALSIRSGALLDTLGLLYGRWHLSPQIGSDLFRELGRIHAVATGEPYDTYRLIGGSEEPLEIAGNSISRQLLTGLLGVEPFAADAADLPLRVARIEGDPRTADRHFPGRAPWRTAEPEAHDDLAAAVALDIADWIATCDG